MEQLQAKKIWPYIMMVFFISVGLVIGYQALEPKDFALSIPFLFVSYAYIARGIVVIVPKRSVSIKKGLAILTILVMCAYAMHFLLLLRTLF